MALVGRIPQEEVGANPDFVIDTEWIPAIGMLFHTFEDNAVRLQEIIQFTRGVKTSDDKRFVATAKNTPQHKPVIRGRDVERYAFRWSGEYLWYRPDLMREKVGSLPHSPSLFEVPEKLITQRVNSSGQLIVCYDDAQVYSLDTTNVSVLKNWNKLYSLKYLAALLNSKAIQFWYVTNSVCQQFRATSYTKYRYIVSTLTPHSTNVSG